jgi:hypothetical protein
MHDDAHRTLLTILSPSAREHLRNVLIRNQADGGAIASQLLRNRDLRGWRGRTLLISSHSTLSSAARMSDSSGSWRHRVMSDRPEIDPAALERLSSALVNRLDGLRGTTPSSPWSVSYILEATAEGWTAYKVMLWLEEKLGGFFVEQALEGGPGPFETRLGFTFVLSPDQDPDELAGKIREVLPTRRS